MAEELWPILRFCRSEHPRRTWHPAPDTSASDTLVVVVLAGERQSDTDTLPGERIELGWPRRLLAGWQRHTEAAGEDDEEQTASLRPGVRTDSRSSCWCRTVAGEQSPAGMVDNRPVPYQLPRNCTMGVAVRALEFGCLHIADMRPVEPHRMDNHY